MESILLASFVAGFLTVLAPCLLPLLPVVIGGSLAGRKRNAYIIIGSLLLSVVVFTLLIHWLSSLLYIPQEVWRYIAAVLILGVGMSFLVPSLWGRVPFVARYANAAVGAGMRRSGVIGDIAVGASLGPAFSSCSPTYLIILAVIIPADFLEGLLYLSAYAVGIGVVLLFIALFGQSVVERLSAAADTKGWVKRGAGILLILIALTIFTGLDKAFSVFLLDLGFFDASQFEIETIPD